MSSLLIFLIVLAVHGLLAVLFIVGIYNRLVGVRSGITVDEATGLRAERNESRAADSRDAHWKLSAQLHENCPPSIPSLSKPKTPTLSSMNTNPGFL